MASFYVAAAVVCADACRFWRPGFISAALQIQRPYSAIEAGLKMLLITSLCSSFAKVFAICASIIGIHFDALLAAWLFCGLCTRKIVVKANELSKWPSTPSYHHAIDYHTCRFIRKRYARRYQCLRRRQAASAIDIDDCVRDWLAPAEEALHSRRNAAAHQFVPLHQ